MKYLNAEGYVGMNAMYGNEKIEANGFRFLQEEPL